MNRIPAFDPDTLYLKSKTYVQRGLAYDANNQHEEFQLWAALSLELLGKSTLAFIHPVLVADVEENSVFAACGITHGIKTRPKTAAANAIFARLASVVKNFTAEEGHWCKILSDRRNAELHSGELPYVGVKRDEWLGKFWRICEVVLAEQNKSLEDWLGEPGATQAREDIEQSPIRLIVSKKLEGHKTKFEKEYPTPEERKAAVKLSQSFTTYDAFENAEEIDRTVHFKCPSCNCMALLGGSFWEEQDLSDEDGAYIIEVYSTEMLHCRICNLKLNGRDELNAAKIPEDFDVEKEYDYDDYGND